MNPDLLARADLLAKAAHIRAACVAALEVCAKRTPGEWHARETRIYFPRMAGGFDIKNCPVPTENVIFIALASRMTEPALRSTMIAIEALIFSIKLQGVGERERAKHNLTALLACWPDEEAAK